jgi:hypothetical protein
MDSKISSSKNNNKKKDDFKIHNIVDERPNTRPVLQN